MLVSLVFLFLLFQGGERLVGFGFSGDERLICRVTGPRRFPPSNHATGSEKSFLGRKKAVEDFLSITRKPTPVSQFQRDLIHGSLVR